MKCVTCKYGIHENDGGNGHPADYCSKGHWYGIDPEDMEHPEDNHLWDNCPDYEYPISNPK